MPAVDVVVVGAGVMGSATARSLAGLGREVVLLERFELGHDHGSSHGASRVFRFSYSDPTYVRMAMEALPLWRRLEEETGTALLTTVGGIDVGDPVGRNAEALRAAGAVCELIDGAEAMRRFPVFSLPPDAPAMWQPDSGVLAADGAVRALAAAAVARGADLRQGVEVVEVRVNGDGAEVRTADATLRARVVVVTAGAWAKGLLAPIGIDLPVRVTRETIMYFPLAPDTTMPVMVEWGTPPLYTLPTAGFGVKTGEHGGGPDADPDVPGGPDEGAIQRVSAWVTRRLPGAEPVPHGIQTCLYTSTADERFILERHGPIVVGSPCSGHGFKFAPLIGERLAALATG